MARYHVSHTTTYVYSEPVSICHNEIHLIPREHPGQRLERFQLRIEPMPAFQDDRIDYFGNHATLFSVQERHTKFEVACESDVVVSEPSLPSPLDTPPWELAREALIPDHVPHSLEACQFAFDSPYVRIFPELLEYAAPSFEEGRPLLDAVLDLTRRIHTEFRYDSGATNVSTPLREVLEERHGVCQDFAHLEIGCLRSLGLPARYISGYLLTVPPPGQPRLVGADASHAWLSIYCPGHGWIDLDPTNNLIPGDKHVTVAWGRDYGDVSPIKGVILGGGQHTIHVAVDVLPLADADEIGDDPHAEDPTIFPADHPLETREVI